MSFLNDLGARLVSRGVGTIGQTVFFSSKAILPTKGTPAFLTLRDTGGTGPERTHNSVSTPAYVRPTAQIVCCADTYEAAMALARAAYDAFVGIRNEVVGTSYYREVNALQEPFDLGLDTANRARVAFNVMSIKRP